MTQGRLSAADIESATLPAGKRMHKLNDGGGLFLQVEERSKAWRFRYSLNGRDALMSLGTYPAVSLDAARSRAAEERRKLARGESPAAARRAERDAAWLEAHKTFGVVAVEYNMTQAHRSEQTRDRCARMLQHSKALHSRTFAELDRPTMLAACRALEAAGKHETAHRLGIYFSQVFRFARDEGYYKGEDPTLGGFGKSLKPVTTVNRPALTDPKAVGGLMRNVDGWEWLGSGATVGRALQVLARTVVRPGELAAAEWSELDLDGSRHDGEPTWVIPLARMKMKDANRTDHIVPLSRQAVDILRAQYTLTGHGRYVWPNARSDKRPMSDTAMSAALLALSYRDQHCPHGFRSTFSTLARNELKAESELIELQLAHRVGSDVRGAYDRAQRIPERRALMQAYSDLLERLK